MDKPYYINEPNRILAETPAISILENNDPSHFHSLINGYRPTPLFHLPGLSQKYNVGNIYVKDESNRFGLHSFKALGASYAIHRILSEKPEAKVFCTATDGNHGCAVAWAARRFNKEAVVFVPETITSNRIKAIKNEGARVIKVDGNYDYSCEIAKYESKNNNWQLVQDTSWEDYVEIPSLIMAGYLTLFKEMETNLHPPRKPKIDIVILQAGVGSFAGAGIYYYLKKYGINSPGIVIVEPKEADGILTSFKRNRISTSKGNSCTVMAGLNCETPSFISWDLLKSGVDISIRIEDRYAKKAVKELHSSIDSDPRILAGESGAAGFAGFISIMEEKQFIGIRNELDINETTNILFINTEGDTHNNLFCPESSS